MSQPTRQTSASKSWACTISSIESAITSRETRDARIPGRSLRLVVGDGDRVEAERHTAGRRDTVGDALGELALVEVARHRPGPRRRDPDDRAVEAGGIDAHRAEVGARRCALGSGSKRGAGSAAKRVVAHAARIRFTVARIRLGLLSTASINGAILAARSDGAPFEIVAVGSRDAVRAEAYAREHGIAARAWPSYDALLADEGIDAVYIALAERAASRMDDARAGGGQARARREAVHARAGGGRRGVGARRSSAVSC